MKTINLPPISKGLLHLFTVYSRYYLRRHCHTLRLYKANTSWRQTELPIVIFANHPSWWDPLVGLILSQTDLSNRQHYAPMDAQALQKYAFFRRLGFFPVERNRSTGAAQFLRTSLAILNEPNTVLWLTPQGRFSDPRERPIRFQPGLGHLAQHLDRALFVPLAMELCFWEERTPEALALFGAPIYVERNQLLRRNAQQWTQFFEETLETALDTLSRAAQTRNPAPFEILLSGDTGVGWIYDFWRAWRARIQGKVFSPQHSHL